MDWRPLRKRAGSIAMSVAKRVAHVGANLVEHGLAGTLVAPRPRDFSSSSKKSKSVMPPTSSKSGKRYYRRMVGKALQLTTPSNPFKGNRLLATASKPGRLVKKMGSTYVRNFGAATSKSAGYVKARKRIKRRGRKAKQFKMLKGGVYFTKETGGTLSSEFTRYLGHATYGATDMIIDTIFTSMVKAVLFKTGFMINDPDQQMTTAASQGLNGADLVSFGYRLTPDDIITNLDFAIGTYSLKGLGAALAYAYKFSGPSVDTKLVYIRYKPDTGDGYNRAIINLNNAKIHLDIKSSFKLQNRSINSTGNDEADDVDNVPLFGKAYYGKGNGSDNCGGHMRVGVPDNYIADRIHGVINRNADTLMNKEPLLPEVVVKATKTGKIHLDPGQIKTSVLVDRHVHDLNNLLSKTLFYITNPGTQRVFRTPGQFQFFGLEKMLEVYPYVDVEGVPTLSIIPFIVAFEHNVKVGAMLKPGWNSNATSMAILDPSRFTGT